MTRKRASVAAAPATVMILSGCTGGAGGGGGTTLTITANAVKGGKNSAKAAWITDYVIPKFEQAEKAKGKKVTVRFEGTGVDDAPYKQKIALDLKTGGGSDLIDMDGIWVGEFAQAGYIKPLDQVGGAGVDQWDGLAQIPAPVKGIMQFGGRTYGLPAGTDGRVLFFNKKLFQQAGLPATWQPTSWNDILAAARKLKTIKDVTPIQLDAGTGMTEATTMQGVLPMLVGTGRQIYENGKWLGDTPQMRQVLSLYKEIYATGGLGDPKLQENAQGRDESFQRFAQNKVGILLESDYFWRSVVNPQKGIDPMADRDQTVGYTLIPAQNPGTGIKGQNYVSMSGGDGWVINPHSKDAPLAWELLKEMGSYDAVAQEVHTAVIGISPRNDVNDKLLTDPLMTFISTKVLPITATRPGLAAYPQVSTALQAATDDIVAGQSLDAVAKTYERQLEQAIGGAGNVTTG